jgi:hypothetical protein
MLQCAPAAKTSCCSCWGIMHVHGEQRDRALLGGGHETQREIAVGAQVVLTCVRDAGEKRRRSREAFGVARKEGAQEVGSMGSSMGSPPIAPRACSRC